MRRRAVAHRTQDGRRCWRPLYPWIPGAVAAAAGWPHPSTAPLLLSWHCVPHTPRTESSRRQPAACSTHTAASQAPFMLPLLHYAASDSAGRAGSHRAVLASSRWPSSCTATLRCTTRGRQRRSAPTTVPLSYGMHHAPATCLAAQTARLPVLLAERCRSGADLQLRRLVTILSP